MPRRTLKPFHTQEERLLARVETSADVIDRAIERLWREVLAEIKPGTPWLVMQRRIADVLRRLPQVIATVAQQLAETVTDSVQSAHTTVRDQVARPLMEDTATERLTAIAFDAILPAPSREQVYQTVFASGWQRRLAELTRLADPEVLGSVVAQTIARGDTPRQAAEAIRPFVQDVRTSALRIARHESIRVAHEARLQAYEQLGDFVEGYQIHAVLDSRTRPEHRRRDGTIYYRNPKPGQLGFDRMPRPPMEADGSVAFNCRCYLTPILGD